MLELSCENATVGTNGLNCLFLGVFLWKLLYKYGPRGGGGTVVDPPTTFNINHCFPQYNLEARQWLISIKAVLRVYLQFSVRLKQTQFCLPSNQSEKSNAGL